VGSSKKLLCDVAGIGGTFIKIQKCRGDEPKLKNTAGEVVESRPQVLVVQKTFITSFASDWTKKKLDIRRRMNHGSGDLGRAFSCF